MPFIHPLGPTLASFLLNGGGGMNFPPAAAVCGTKKQPERHAWEP